jgi:hypothetical protein
MLYREIIAVFAIEFFVCNYMQIFPLTNLEFSVVLLSVRARACVCVYNCPQYAVNVAPYFHLTQQIILYV